MRTNFQRSPARDQVNLIPFDKLNEFFSKHLRQTGAG
jgi:hypothetical protein